MRRPSLGTPPARPFPLAALLALALAPVARAADCTPAALDQAFADTMAAFEAMDAAALTAARTRAEETLGCVEVPIPATTVASVHRIEGIAAFLARDVEASGRYFHAAVAADRGYQFPVKLVPAGHPMQKIYTAAAAQMDGPIESVTVPRGYALWVDGREAGTRPLDRPAVLQLVADEKAAWTGYVAAGAGLPTWDVPVIAPVVEEAPPDPRSDAEPEPQARSRMTGPLALASIGALATSAASYAVASGHRNRFDDPATPYDEIEGLQGKTNTWMSMSIATGVVGVGLGVTSALTTVRF